MDAAWGPEHTIPRRGGATPTPIPAPAPAPATLAKFEGERRAALGAAARREAP